MSLITKIYPNELYEAHDAVYLDLKSKTKGGSEKKVGLGSGLFDRDFRKASWVCIFLAISNQMSGINIINIYAYTIFKTISDSGAEMPLSAKSMTYFIGASGFVGAYLGNFTVKQFSRRGLLINSHLMMAVCLGLVGFMVH